MLRATSAHDVGYVGYLIVMANNANVTRWSSACNPMPLA
jgi:hypothetical protein